MRGFMSGVDASPGRWLSIVGIGEDGIEGLSAAARREIAAAEVVFGGARHLALAAPLIAGAQTAWPSPFQDGIAAALACRGRRVCVLASGDPFLHGVGATLAAHVPPQEMQVLPAPSAFSLAAARLGWPLAEVVTLSLHGREVARIRPYLHPGARLLALTSDADGPTALAALLAGGGFGATTLTVLEALGGPHERMRVSRADGFALHDVQPLNLVALEVAADARARILPLTPGLDDALFESDGQLTKREVRAMTLAALAPRRGELLWDIGGGSGSVAIEWMLADASLRAVSIEQRADRAARIARNATAFGVPHLDVVEGTAPAALAGLPKPDAVFIGGGSGAPGLIEAAMAALPAAGRLVINAVTLESEARLLACHAAHGGALTRIAIARAEPVGGVTGWRPAMPVTQWAWTKP
jgi:precorrin-6Y C5,15-methyltransferase (decarboxylating)